MYLRTPHAAALLLAATVAAAVAFVERVDGHILLATKTWHLDPVGETKLWYTRLTRSCVAVQGVSAEAAALAIAQSDIEEDSRLAAPMPRTASSLQGWLLIETEFTNSEPAIVLLRPEEGRYKQAAVYSGAAAPFNDTQVIHALFAAGSSRRA